MEIDWLTVGAQIVNFLVLVWLLQHFLYGPVTKAMARREARIAERVRSAEQRETDAEHERDALRAQKDRLVAEGDALLAAAREDAEAERERLLRAARDEVEASRHEWQRQLQDERDGFLTEVRRDTAEGFAALARKALSDLADVALEEQMIATLGRRLAALDDAERADWRDHADLTVTTAGLLDAERREAATARLREQLGTDIAPRFEQDPDLLCGIALNADARRLGWSLADYLDDFERRLMDRLEQGRRQAGGSDPKERQRNQSEEASEPEAAEA